MSTVEDLKNKRSMAKSQFTRSEKRLKDAISQELSTCIMTKRLDELTVKWDTVQKCHDELILASPPIDDAALKTEESWIEVLEDRFCNLEVEAIDKINEKAVEKTAVNNAASVVNSNIGAVQLERMKIEKFDGDIREHIQSLKKALKSMFSLYAKRTSCPSF